jgi:hypothetical protein
MKPRKTVAQKRIEQQEKDRRDRRERAVKVCVQIEQLLDIPEGDVLFREEGDQMFIAVPLAVGENLMGLIDYA